MKKYPKYKDSGFEFIGNIPENWVCSKLRYEASLTLGKMLEDKEPKGDKGQYSLEAYLKSRNIGMLEVFSARDQVEKMWFSDKEKQIYELQEGDLVMNEGGDIGKVSLWKDPGYRCYIQNSVHKITPNKKRINSVYLQYLLFHISKRGYFTNIVNAISIAHLTKEKLSVTPIIVPPLFEQEQIAFYLDYKTEKIDSLVSMFSDRIEDLKKYRKAFISETVTHGLDKSAKMKDSGVDWIDVIPENWGISKVKYLMDNLDFLRKPISADERERTNPQYDYYGASGVIDRIDHYNVEDTVLLIGEDGANLASRNLPLIYKASGRFWVNNHAHILKPKSSCCYDYYFYLMEAADYTNYITGALQPKLSQENLSNVLLPAPPLLEQQAIADYLDRKTKQIDDCIAATEQRIEDLKKYRSSLIYEAVTGQIDVRDWTPNKEKNSI